MHILFFVISRSQLQTIIVQIFAHVGVEPYATFKARKIKLPHPLADPLWQMTHSVEGKEKNARQMPGRDGCAWY